MRALTKVAQVQIPEATPYVGQVCCSFLQWNSGFPLLKTNISLPIRPGKWQRGANLWIHFVYLFIQSFIFYLLFLYSFTYLFIYAYLKFCCRELIFRTITQQRGTELHQIQRKKKLNNILVLWKITQGNTERNKMV